MSPGQQVVPGQILVTLASPAVGMAQSDAAKATAMVTAARAQAAYALAAKQRAERLLALKAIARQDYERTVADDAQAQAMLDQALAEFARAKSAVDQLGGTGAQGEIAVRAPFAGVVLIRTAVPGTVVDIGAPLITITDPTTLWLIASAPEALIGNVRKGAELHFRVPAFPTEDFSARVDAIGAGLDPATRTLSVRSVIRRDARHSRLRPEMLASVLIPSGPTGSMIVVPEIAVQLLDGKSVVFVVTPTAGGGATFTAREIEVAGRGNARVSVLKGLAVGDVVVVAGAARVKAQLQNGNMPEMSM